MSTHLHEFLLSAEGLAYSLADGRTLFENITLGFGRERTGLVGPNGIGKSTFARLLTGELRPSAGHVHRRGTLAWLPQSFEVHAGRPLAAVLGIDDRLAALDRLSSGIGEADDVELVGDDWDLRERAEALLSRFGLGHLSLDRPAANVSGGEATRVALAGLLLLRPDFLVLDEPTNNLDAAGRRALCEFADEWTGGMLVISHDRALLSRMDRILELSGLGPRLYGGSYEAHRAQRAAEDEAAGRELDSARAALRTARREAQRMRERQEKRESHGKKAAAVANMPKILLGMRRERSEGTTARVRDTTARLVDEGRERLAAARARVEERERLSLALPPSHVPAGKMVLEMDGITYAHLGAPEPLIRDFSLRIVGPERVAVVGPNGSGKTTLLHLALGRLAPSVGTVRLGVGEREAAFFDQHARRLRPDLSVLENYRAANPEMDETQSRLVLARFLFPDEAALQPAATLSGGQRLRAALACAVNGLRPPKLLVLDEPTNHLDLDSLDALEGILAGYDGALLVVSHDAAFLEAVGIDRYVALERGAPPAERVANARFVA